MSSAKPRTGRDIVDFSYSLPSDLKKAVEQARERWEQADSTSRLWKKDATLWSNQDESKWLGWLDIVGEESVSVSKFKALAAEIAEDGFTHFVLLGMGGSSLCPEVFSLTFGKQAHAPELLVLDSTDPLQIRASRALRSSRTSTCSISSTRRRRS
jgi:glucose-6-phosphate isomerase